MQPFLIYSAFLLGFAGSFHCMGMCGPIALGFSGAKTEGKSQLQHYLLYFSGKTITYGLLGLVFGLFGQGLVLAGLQRGLSVMMGIVMLLLVIISIFKSEWFHRNPATLWVQEKIIPLFGKLIKTNGAGSSIGLGLLNGLLPCGLVYIGLTAAIATGSALQAATYMLIFGLGTIPLMLGFVLFTLQISYVWKVRLRKLTPVLMTLIGTLLILRGLNLGIPYVSPLMDSLMMTGARGAEVVPCHP